MCLYQFIHEQNKVEVAKPSDTDRVYYSELHEWHTTNAFRNFSIKCVLEGSICYKLGGNEHVVQAGHFLTAVRQPEVLAYFHSMALVKSICIDVRPQTVAEVFTLIREKNEPEMDNYLAGHFRYPEFYESINSMCDSPAGQKLKDLGAAIRKDKTNVHVTTEWIYDLAEQIVYQEFRHFSRLRNIRAAKASTRKEIYRRVSLGRDYLKENFLQVTTIREAARACHMSDYFFLRSFRDAFACTPFQYLQKLKLEHATMLLAASELFIGDIAEACGFTDIYTFSKAFKRTYGVAPSLYRSFST
jgi:AraC family transcriptional regulator